MFLSLHARLLLPGVGWHSFLHIFATNLPSFGVDVKVAHEHQNHIF